jgi:hypothetical protein
LNGHFIAFHAHGGAFNWKMRDNFEGMVYDLTSGKGKSRSNRDLGVRYENSWKLVTITTGETELRSFVTQGGALNRILEIKAPDRIFDDPHRVVEVLKLHNGWAGRIFVNAIKKIGTAELKQRYEKVLQSVREAAEDSMQKQTMALAAVLLADEIAEEYLWDDEILIKPEEAVGCLASQSEVMPGERAYNLIVDAAVRFEAHFSEGITSNDRWGVMKDGSNVICWIPSALDDFCKMKQLDRKTFEKWGVENKVITPYKDGKTSTPMKFFGKTKRLIVVKLPEYKDAVETIDELESQGYMSELEPPKNW